MTTAAVQADDRLAEFHALVSHAGPADGCHDPCVCATTDEALDLILDAEAYGLYDAGMAEWWSE
jgi:hypothetical protein